MNESTQKILKIHIEQAVRPVNASLARKRKMREDLLAHAVKIYSDLRISTDCPQVALDQTVLALGQSADLSNQLQASVPAIDRLTQFLEGPPDEPAWRGALGFVFVVALFSLAAVGITLFLVGFNRPWTLQELLAISTGPEYLPLCMFHTTLILSCFVLTVHFLEKQLDGALAHTGLSFWSALLRPNTRLLLIKAWLILNTTLLFILLTANRNALSSPKIYWTIMLITPFMTFFANWGAWHMVTLAQEKRKHHAEWSNLPLDNSSS